MGQKTNPIGLRLGINRGWDSNWYGGKNFKQKLLDDDKVRKYLNARLAKAGVSRILIERTLKLVTVTIFTARPGISIGKGGQEVDKLKEELKKLTNQEIQINISEIKRPELDAVIVGNSIARQILLEYVELYFPHLLKHRSAQNAVRIGQCLDNFEVVVVFCDD